MGGGNVDCGKWVGEVSAMVSGVREILAMVNGWGKCWLW